MSLLTMATAGINIALGAVYVSYALITIADLRRNHERRGASHLAYGFIAIMLTCGPHHVDHGIHLLTGDDPAGALDLLVTLTGLPTGVVWFLLRVEALRGGVGDRQLSNDLVIEVLRTLMVVGMITLMAALLAFEVGTPTLAAQLPTFRLLPNTLIVALYLTVGVVLLRTQLRRHRVDGTWSLSGLALTGVFPTCAAMHAVWIGYVAIGRYQPDTHLLVIDTMAVPATVYFLVVTWRLGRGWLPDWAEAAGDVARPAGAEAAEVDDLLGAR